MCDILISGKAKTYTRIINDQNLYFLSFASYIINSCVPFADFIVFNLLKDGLNNRKEKLKTIKQLGLLPTLLCVEKLKHKTNIWKLWNKEVTKT